MRAWVALGACVLVGLAAGAIWTLAQPDRYRADARLQVHPVSNRIVPAVQTLAESSLVEANVAQTLHLASPPHLSAKTRQGGILTLSVEAGSRERARQIDAEAVVVTAQKVAQRFGASAGVTTTLLDPAHAAEQTSPTPGRNLLITGLAGLVAGLAAAGGWWRTRATRTATVDPGAERRLEARIDEVGKRERALAHRAGELAAREKELERRERELDRQLAEREAQLDARDAEPRAAASEAQPEQPPPEPDPEPEPAPIAAGGGWNLRALERLVQEQGTKDPEASEEWSAYLFLLREHADHEGALPPSFDPLIADVFGNLPGLLASRDAPEEI